MVEIITTVGLEVVKRLTSPTERQISYLLSYNNNFENLKKEIEEMKGNLENVRHAVEEAERQGEDIEVSVNKWLKSVTRAVTEAEKLVVIHEDRTNKRCFKGMCPNLKARLQLSKDAVRQREHISILREAGRLFDRISYRSIPEDIRLLSSKDYVAFESRMSTTNDVLGALKDPNVNMLGIYGMGGVGKTTLAKEVARQVNREFDQIIFVEVSQSLDIRKMQCEIADKLGLRLDEKSEHGRASSIYDRLKKEKRIFIILDNIWENLDLQAVGIPHGDNHRGCKVLLTTRNLDVWKMHSQRNFQVGVLKEEEAWSLFKKMAGDYIEGNEFKSVATEVAKKCAGLPVSILTVGRALRNKTLVEWNDALEQLRSPWLKSFPDMQPAAYSAITLSYNKLEVEELKKIFLLIAHANLESVDELLMYGMGLGLFEGIYHMEEARDPVRTLIYKLKASCMLLDHISNDEEWFSVHGVVHDIAISIATREQNVITITNGEPVNLWELCDESSVMFYSSIVLLDVKTNSALPEVLDCPELKLFRMVAAEKSLSLTIPEIFFAKMIQVRVLDLTYMNLLSLPSSLGLLTNLQTLCLCYCELEDIAVVGNLKKLEILCLKGSEIKQLSEELGQLSQLKLLDLRNCWKLEVIPPNVLLKLFCLEELYIDSFKKWGMKVEGLKNASLDELKHLPNLTSLELQINNINALPRGLVFKNLERFNIYVGYDDIGLDGVAPSSNSVLPEGLDCPQLKFFCIRPAEKSSSLIQDIAGVGNFKKLEILHLQGCKIKQLPAEVGQLTDLKLLDLRYCGELEVIPPNVLTKLSHLEELYIYSFKNWEVEVERLKNASVQELKQLPNLTSLELRIKDVNTLPKGLFFEKLERFNIFIGQDNNGFSDMAMRTKISKTFKLELDNNIRLKDVLIVELKGVEDLRLSGLQEQDVKYLVDELVKVGSLQLKHLFVKGYDAPNSKIQQRSTYYELLNNEIFDGSAFFLQQVAILNLESLTLHSLNIERIWQSQPAAMSCGVQNLTNLTIHGCRNLKCIFSSSILRSCVRLQNLKIERCPILEEIIMADPKKTKSVMFPRLQFLELKNLKKLTKLCSGDVHIKFPSLEKIKISECRKFLMVNYKSSDHHLTKKIREESTTDIRLKEIIDDDSLFIEKVAIPNLKSIYLDSINVENIWQNQLAAMSCGIQNIVNLEVNDCRNLKSLFSSSIFSSCVRLRYLKIANCPSLKEIAARDEITFRELEELHLYNLNSLICFYSGNCSLKLPYLKTLTVENCPNMKIFSGGELSTPKLHQVQRYSWTEEFWIWKDDLNTTIQQLYLEKKKCKRVW